MKNIIIIIILSLSLFLWGCKKEPITEPPQTLPEATQIGANTFGCKVNGKVVSAFTICEPTGTGGIQNWGNEFTESCCYIKRLNWDSTNIRYSLHSNNLVIELRSKNNISVGDVLFDVEVRQGSNNGTYQYYYLENNIGNKLTLTKRTSNIHAGEFEFYAMNQIDSTDILHITEGRFDIREP